MNSTSASNRPGDGVRVVALAVVNVHPSLFGQNITLSLLHRERGRELRWNEETIAMYGNGISQRRYQTQLDPEHLLLFDYQLIEIQCHTDPPAVHLNRFTSPHCYGEQLWSNLYYVYHKIMQMKISNNTN